MTATNRSATDKLIYTMMDPEYADLSLVLSLRSTAVSDRDSCKITKAKDQSSRKLSKIRV